MQATERGRKFRVHESRPGTLVPGVALHGEPPGLWTTEVTLDARGNGCRCRAVCYALLRGDTRASMWAFLA